MKVGLCCASVLMPRSLASGLRPAKTHQQTHQHRPAEDAKYERPAAIVGTILPRISNCDRRIGILPVRDDGLPACRQVSLSQMAGPSTRPNAKSQQRQDHKSKMRGIIAPA